MSKVVLVSFVKCDEFGDLDTEDTDLPSVSVIHDTYVSSPPSRGLPAAGTAGFSFVAPNCNSPVQCRSALPLKIKK